MNPNMNFIISVMQMNHFRNGFNRCVFLTTCIVSIVFNIINQFRGVHYRSIDWTFMNWYTSRGIFASRAKEKNV